MSEWERRLEEAGKLGDSGSSDSKQRLKKSLQRKKDYLGGRKSRHKLGGENHPLILAAVFFIHQLCLCTDK